MEIEKNCTQCLQHRHENGTIQKTMPVRTRAPHIGIFPRGASRWCSVWGSCIVYLVLFTCLPCVFATNNRRGAKHTVTYEIWEESEVGTFIGNLATDARLNREFNASVLASLTYTFLGQSEYAHYFTLDENLGRLQIAEEVDRDVLCPMDTLCEITLDVAIRPIEYFRIIKLIIEILDLNDNSPSFPNPHTHHSISESTLVGVIFPITPATDPDSPPNGIRHYELQTSSDKFELQVRNNSDGSKDLQLILREPVNREVRDFYQLRIMAYDGGSPQLSGTLLIDLVVTDINDNSPAFSNASYEIAVEETTSINSTLLVVEALDADSGSNGQIDYGFTSRTQRTYGHIFGIDASRGQIYLKQHLDAEVQPSYSLSVTAQDQGPDSLPTTVKVTVHVIDVNDHEPEISINVLTDETYAEVPEDSPVPYFVAYISVFDPDLGDNGVFNCTLDDTFDFSLVQLYDTEFKVEAITSFDRELQSEYRMNIICEDQGTPAKTSHQELVVQVADRNDHAPHFLEAMYITTLEENNNINEFIVQVSAVDSDSEANSRIEYQLAENVWDILNIDAGSGVVTAGISFDREDMGSLDFRVTAVDQGTPPQTATAMVLLTILDQDDQVPKFRNRLYNFDIEEDADIGTEVGVVHAIDGDMDPNNKFLFSLLGSTEIKNLFRVDPVSGIISTLRPLDRETQDVYRITAHVHSTSTDLSRLNDTAEVIIHITDVNDNAPIIDFPKLGNRTVGISNLVPIGFIVTQIIAHDNDFSRNGKITFFISEGNEDGAFAIGGKTGDVYVNGDVHGLDGETYRLVIMAQDDGVPQRLTAAVLYININHTIPYYPPAGITGQNEGGLSEIHLIIIIAIIVGTFCIVVSIIVAIILMRKKDRCCRSSKCHTNSTGVKGTLPYNAEQTVEPGIDPSSGHTLEPAYMNMQPPSYDSQALVTDCREKPVHVNDINMAMPNNMNNMNNGGITNMNGIHMSNGMMIHKVHESDDDDMSVSNSGSDNSKVNIDTLSPANTEKDTDSGCCADMSSNPSTMDPNLQLFEDSDHRSPNGSILKIKCYHPPQHRRQPPTNRQTSFSDWVMSENQNLRQNGHVYRVAQTEAGRNKSVRFNDKNTPLTGDDDHEARSSSPAALSPGHVPPPAPAPAPSKSGRLTTFAAPRHRAGVDTIPEEPESQGDLQNNLQFIPHHTESRSPHWNDGSLV